MKYKVLGFREQKGVESTKEQRVQAKGVERAREQGIELGSGEYKGVESTKGAQSAKGVERTNEQGVQRVVELSPLASADPSHFGLDKRI